MYYLCVACTTSHPTSSALSKPLPQKAEVYLVRAKPPYYLCVACTTSHPERFALTNLVPAESTESSN